MCLLCGPHNEGDPGNFRLFASCTTENFYRNEQGSVSDAVSRVLLDPDEPEVQTQPVRKSLIADSESGPSQRPESVLNWPDVIFLLQSNKRCAWFGHADRKGGRAGWAVGGVYQSHCRRS